MFEPPFLYLDSDVERQQLVGAIQAVRSEVLTLVETLPADLLYTPRYHGWSPAAMLAHLSSTDTTALLLIQLGMLGIRLPIPLNVLNWYNDTMARLLRRRLVTTTAEDVARNEARICDLIMRLPMSQFTAQVFHPPMQANLTVERALQVFFLHHWQLHLETMRQVEGVSS